MSYTQGCIVRIYPDKRQEQEIFQHVHACRYVWNYMLKIEKDKWQADREFYNCSQLQSFLKKLKNSETWLKKMSNSSLQTIYRDLYSACMKYKSGRKGFPNYKSKKKEKFRYPLRHDKSYFKNDKSFYISVIGNVKYTTDFELPVGRSQRTKIKNPRIWIKNPKSKRRKFFVCFGIEYENQVLDTPKQKLSIGIDLGIRSLAVIASSDGKREDFGNINKSKEMRRLKKKLKSLQCAYDIKHIANNTKKTQTVSKRMNNIVGEIEVVNSRIADIRLNYIRQVINSILKLKPTRIVMENLNIQKMQKNKRLAPYIQEACWYKFKEIVKYKCQWNNIEFVEADKFYASSQICSRCGNRKKITLRERTYVCDNCNNVIDRDYNAALNLMKYEV